MTQHTTQPAWMQTASGMTVTLPAPDPASIRITDIAESLAKQCRFNGHIPQFYSVAQHCCIVADLVPARLKLYALLHDAHEAYIGDIIAPVKQAMRGMSRHRTIQRLEEQVDEAIHTAFRLSWPLSDHDREIIHRADMIALATEKRDICTPGTKPWDELPPAADFLIRPAPWPKAAEKFLKYFVKFAWDTAPQALDANNIDPLNHRQEAY